MAFLLPIFAGVGAALGTAGAAESAAVAGVSAAVAGAEAIGGASAAGAVGSAAFTAAEALSTPLVAGITGGQLLTGLAAGASGGLVTGIGNEIVYASLKGSGGPEPGASWRDPSAAATGDDHAIALLADQAIRQAKNYENGPGGRITPQDLANAAAKYGVNGPAVALLDRRISEIYGNDQRVSAEVARIMQQYARDRLLPSSR